MYKAVNAKLRSITEEKIETLVVVLDHRLLRTHPPAFFTAHEIARTDSND